MRGVHAVFPGPGRVQGAGPQQADRPGNQFRHRTLARHLKGKRIIYEEKMKIILFSNTAVRRTKKNTEISNWRRK